MKDHPLEACYKIAECSDLMNQAIAELAHAGDSTFYFDDVLGNTNLKAMMIQTEELTACEAVSCEEEINQAIMVLIKSHTLLMLF